MKTFSLEIITPYGYYLKGDASFLSARSEEYNLGILPDHAPLISTLDICVLKVAIDNQETLYAIGGGVITIENNKVILLLKSIESKDEIDIERARQAKLRAENRINDNGKDLDINRAKKALARAVNRLRLIGEE